MLASISPLGERARGNRWSMTVGSFVAASTLAGAAAGALAGTAGAGVAAVRILGLDGTHGRVALIVAAIVAAAIDAGVVPVRLRPTRRQVNEYWLDRYRGWVYGAGFGAQLGVGLATIVTTATVYLTLVAAFLSSSWREGAIIGATFGAARAVPVLGTARVHTAAALRSLHTRLAHWSRAAAWLTVAGTVGAAGLLLGSRW